ncbi:hypothetical protein GMOD_00000872 [Pyrenophora seminiperda CCB06]|uniref:Uncharacterized protein n=1 Tax=Pyrenophora seminiperda CCB06 TaxID=1302712 RepID=A0A3M7M8M8_9PLEO|nr:hypothetical protein GMOD_00000872 [Pyrenophora seminiperda CCB06]
MQFQVSSILATMFLLSGVVTAQTTISCTGDSISFGGPCTGNTNSCQCSFGGLTFAGNCDGQGVR